MIMFSKPSLVLVTTVFISDGLYLCVLGFAIDFFFML
jgi:hypothetical protein